MLACTLVSCSFTARSLIVLFLHINYFVYLHTHTLRKERDCSKSKGLCCIVFQFGNNKHFLCFRESMNLILRQKRPCFLEKTLMKKRKKMSDHGKDSHGHHHREKKSRLIIISELL